MAPVWFLTTPAFGEPEQGQPEQAETVTDSSQIDTDISVEGTEEVQDESLNVIVEDSETGGKESNNFGLLGLIFGAAGIAAAGLVWYDSHKKIRALQTAINEKDNLEILSSIKSNKAKVEDLDKLYGRLNTDYTYLRKDFNDLVSRLNKKFQNPNSGANRNTSDKSPSPINLKTDNFKPIPKQIVEPNPEIQTTYVSSLSIDDKGEYSIPMYSLEPGNTQALFKVMLDMQKGEGTYELNPNISNISAYIDTLKMFADGLIASKTSGYKTLVRGKLRREGPDLKVVTKLQIG